MERKVISKLFLALLMTIIVSLIFVSNDVKATSSDDITLALEEVLNTEDKIMKYDAKTKKTTEVDIEELKKELMLQRGINQNEIYSLNSYTPYNKNNLTRQSVYASSDIGVEIVNNTSISPYIKTCRIQFYNTVSQANNYGTASLIGPNIALTAAHCVFNKDNNNSVYPNWTLYPGYNGSSYSGTACGWDTVYYSSSWMDSNSFLYDWAICVLQSNVGNQVGYFGVTCYPSNSGMEGLSVTGLGYPGETDYGFDAQSRYMYKTTGSIVTVTEPLFIFSGKNYKGFSGGPVFNSSNNVLGIIVGHDPNRQAGCVRITQEMLTIIANIRNS